MPCGAIGHVCPQCLSLPSSPLCNCSVCVDTEVDGVAPASQEMQETLNQLPVSPSTRAALDRLRDNVSPIEQTTVDQPLVRVNNEASTGSMTYTGYTVYNETATITPDQFQTQPIEVTNAESIFAIPPKPKPEPEIPLRPVTDQSVRVKIKILANGTVLINSTHQPLPSIQQVLTHLPKQFKLKRTSRYYGLPEVISTFKESIPLQEWANAIASATIMNLSCSPTEATSELKAVANGGYLAIGDSLYRLTACEALTKQSALPAMRKRVMEIAKAESNQIIEAAQIAARALLLDASTSKARADRRLREIERNNVGMPPVEFIKNFFPLIKCNTFWAVGLRINFKPKVLAYHYNKQTATWKTVPAPAVPVLMWVPFEEGGSYSITSCFIDKSSPKLPHVNHDSACMEASMKPRSLKSILDINQLQSAINYCLETVEMDSLYTQPENWSESVRKFFPHNIMEILLTGEKSMLATLAEKKVRAEEKVASEESRTTISISVPELVPDTTQVVLSDAVTAANIQHEPDDEEEDRDDENEEGESEEEDSTSADDNGLEIETDEEAHDGTWTTR